MQMMICWQKTWPVICWDAREGSNRRARPRRASRWHARSWQVFLFDRIFGGMIFGQVMANKSHGGRCRTVAFGGMIFGQVMANKSNGGRCRTVAIQPSSTIFRCCVFLAAGDVRSQKKRFRLFLGFRVFLGSSLGLLDPHSNQLSYKA